MQYVRLGAILLLFTQVGWTGGVIRLKTRNLEIADSSGPPTTVGPLPGVSRHYLILFGSYPGPDVITALQSRRVQVLAYVPENGLMVSALKLNLRGLDAVWAGPMDPADKISPLVSNQPMGSYLVMWHPDTDAAKDNELAQSLGFTVIPNSHLLTGQSLVSGAYSALRSLAGLDQVSYILPASAELQNGDAITGCSGATTQIGPAPQYVLANSGWKRDATGKVALGYYFESLTPLVPESAVRSEIARAFAVWMQYANVIIAPAPRPGLAGTIDILFARYAHGDAYPFYGPGGIIAHTFYPPPSNPEPLAGDMHLNADESWSVGGKVDVFSVALHEAGHALGLGHSDDPASVMYPYYRLQTGLTADDIAGIQALYGAPAGGAPAGSSPGNGGSSATGTGSAAGSGTAGTGTGAGGSGTGTITDTIPPTVAIVSPGSSMVSTTATTISVSGTASDNMGVSRVGWTTSTGGTGTATGTTSWSASVPLLVGNNTITVRAYDAAGNTSWRAITVVRN